MSAVVCLFLVLLSEIANATTARNSQQRLRATGKDKEDNFPKAGGGYGKIFSDKADPIKSPSAQHGGKKCMDLNNDKQPDGVCAPCEKKGDEICKQQEEACSDSLCQLCLHYILACELVIDNDSEEPKEFFENLNRFGSEYSKALCSAIVAKQCSDPKALDCCEVNDHTMFDYVATETTTENGLTRLLPLPQCIHDTTDERLSKELCLLCKSRIKLTFKNTPQRCDDFDHPGAGIYKTNLKPEWRKDAPPLLPDWMGDPPKYRTMREKCDQMNAILERKMTTYLNAPELKKAERWCECLGCCVGTQAPKPADKRICYDMNIFYADWT